MEGKKRGPVQQLIRFCGYIQSFGLDDRYATFDSDENGFDLHFSAAPRRHIVSFLTTVGKGGHSLIMVSNLEDNRTFEDPEDAIKYLIANLVQRKAS